MSVNDVLFGDFITETLTRRHRVWKVVKRVSFFAPFVLTAALSPFIVKQLGFDQIRFTFSLSVSFIALILAGIYFFSYRFFGENFYYFIFVSWLGNAIYLIPELNGRGGWSLTFRLAVTGLSVASTGFLAVALLTRAPQADSKPTWKEIPYRSYLIVGGLALLYLIIAYPALHILHPRDEYRLFAKLVLPTSAASFFLLWAVGFALMLRLRESNPKWIGATLLGSYSAYALLQFTYPFTVYMKNLLPLFLVAQLAKVVNAIAMTGALQAATVHQAAMQKAQLLSGVKIKEAELATQEEKLASRENFVKLGMLASAIKHDIGTPLATMGFDLDALRDQLQHEERSTSRIDSLLESKDRIEAIVKIVDIFRGDKAFFDRDQFMTKASMLEIVHRAVRSVKNEKPELKQQETTIRFKITGRDVWIRAYVPMLEQVLVNVFKNAIEAIEEAKRETGRIIVNVTSTERPDTPYSRWVKVEIEDNGCGIPPENIRKLTSIFTTRGDKKPNSGIGLFIGQFILDIHNGEFDFESEVGEGTLVTLFLPEWNALQKAMHGTSGDGKRESKKSATKEIHTTADALHDSKAPNQQRADATRKDEILQG